MPPASDPMSAWPSGCDARMLPQRRWSRPILRLTAALTLLMAAPVPAAELRETQRLPGLLSLQPPDTPISTTNKALIASPSLDLAFRPGEIADCHIRIPTSTWFNVGAIEWDIVLPPGAPTNIQVLVFLKDWDHLWYQYLLPGCLVPGSTNSCRAGLSPKTAGWIPREHETPWNARALVDPKDVGVRLFADPPVPLTAQVENVEALIAPIDLSPPAIANVIPVANVIPCHSKFEVGFDLPDRYANPFDPDEIAVEAMFETPGGQFERVDGFLTQSFRRQVTPTGEQIVPQGPSRWKVRYAPRIPGEYRYRLTARDRRGSASWGPASFRATPSPNPGYIRVSRRDPRYFEFANGAPFNPIGHNIRSPSDSRMDARFAWKTRWTEGTMAYMRFFSDMQRHGENIAEVWQAPWSLGLEWSDKWSFYHNVGQYNLRNAWEMDHVVENAEQHGILLNVVIHNHGKYSSFSDKEWENNPMNTAQGGFLASPDDYFTDPRAVTSFRNLMRYNIARWGYSATIFAWELWSELNLTGSSRETYTRQEVVDWHRAAAAMIKNMDLGRHLVSTHYSSDYNTVNTNISALADIDHLAVDAYYTSSDCLQVVALLQETARFNRPFSKPALVTEFGGSSSAQGLSHMLACLHAGLWTSTATPVAGTPLFWWWGLIEEENLYPEYLAVSHFMKDEDRRDPEADSCSPTLASTSAPPVRVQAVCLKSPSKANGWIYAPDEFNENPVLDLQPLAGISLSISDLTNGNYQIEFWETLRGTIVDTRKSTVTAGRLTVPVPPFRRDIAFKLRRL